MSPLAIIPIGLLLLGVTLLVRAVLIDIADELRHITYLLEFVARKRPDDLPPMPAKEH